MKKIYLLLGLLSIAIISCKKDTVDINSANGDAQTTNYYKIGTKLDIIGKNIINPGNFTTSYVWFPPEAPNPLNHPDLALNDYKLDTEIARSTNGLYSLFFQTDGNLVLYKRSSPNGDIIWSPALWATNKYLPYSVPSNTNVIPITTFQIDGNIICKGSTSNVYWASNITTNNAIWVLQTDGNLVGYNSTGHGVISGPPFAATFTDGGRVSNNFGKMGKVK